MLGIIFEFSVLGGIEGAIKDSEGENLMLFL
jgi:hypothetical protein